MESPQPIKAIWHPKQVSMIQCPGHQNGDSTEATGNQRLDQAAKEAAQKSSDTTMVLLPAPTLPGVPHTHLRRRISPRKLCHASTKKVWWFMADSYIILPQTPGRSLVKQLHEGIHLSRTKLATFLSKLLLMSSLNPILQDIVSR